MKHIIPLTTSFVVFVASLVLAPAAFAAPIPGTATSKLVSPQLGLYRSNMGFQLNAGASGWKLTTAPKGLKHITAIYRAEGSEAGASVASQIHADLHSGKPTPAPQAAALTVRVDPLKKDMGIEKYVAKWMKEYPRFGFDVLGSKPFTQNKQKGVVAQAKQLRQVVFVKNQKAVILTCRDQQATFQTTLKACNQIIRTFDWTTE